MLASHKAEASPDNDRWMRKRATAVGVVISCVLAVAIVIAGLKAGITPGVSPLVVLVSWAIFYRSLRGSNAKLLLNLVQVAGSAGVAVTAGIIFTAPLLPILSASQGLPYDGLPLLKLTIASVAGALIGFGYVGINARRILADGSLPAPEARACEAMVRVAIGDDTSTSTPETPVDDDDTMALQTARPALTRSLIPGLAHGVFASLLTAVGVASAHVTLWAQKIATATATAQTQIQIPYMPIFFGIGGLLSLGTAVAAFLGTVIRLSGEFWIASPSTNTAIWTDTAMRWVGGGAMTVAVLYSLIGLALQSVNLPQEDEHDAPFLPDMLHVSARTYRHLVINSAVGSLLLLGLIIVLGGVNLFSLTLVVTVTILAAFMVALGAFLSLQIGSSTSPVSGAVFLMTLVLCVVSLLAGRGQHQQDIELMTMVLVAACVAVCTSNDTSQDYRTMQLCRVPIAQGFTAHWLGVISAACIVPFAVVVAERTYGLGSAALPAPQGQLFATVVEGILFNQQLPWIPIAVGVGIGIVAVSMERSAKKKRVVMPSMALAIGLYLPPALGIGLLLGALARYAGDGGKHENSTSILIAGGLITGSALFDLLLGITLLTGMSLDQFQIIAVPQGAQNAIALCGIGLILWLIYRGARPVEKR